MKLFVAITIALVSVASGQQQLRRVVTSPDALNTGAYVAQQNYAPTPFEYAYSSEDVEGTHSAQQSGDGTGRVQGSYTLSLADGRTRTVTYVADENGYRAEVTTNELGTESRNPADVVFTSSALTGEQAALQYGPPAPQRQIVTGGPAQVQVRQLNSQVALPSYGTFAGVQSAGSASASRRS